MAQDEGRFGRISDTRRSWSPNGIRPTVPRQIVRQSLYVFAAVCSSLGKMTALILPFANTDMMSIFLRQLSKDFEDYFIILLIDQAGWHLSEKLQIPENISLIPQPAHSPELNPTEHLWEEIREKYLHNIAFDSLDQLEDVLCLGLNELGNDPDRLSSLTHSPYLNITSLNAT